ncbi:MAG: peptidyl-prolyl cis-trans isomerase [Candidatus Mariimomonas ferrooxydans]
MSVGHFAKERFLKDIIRARLFVREAKRLKMDEQSEVASAIKGAIDGVLTKYYLKEHVLNKIRVTDEEIKAYIEKNAECFQKPETVRVRQILIKVSKDAAPDDMETARKKAEEILARAKAGEDFIRLVEVYSEDKKGRKRGGDMDYVKKGRMGKEFDALVFNLKPGELSPVIKTRKGFSIFKVEGKKPARKLTIKDVRPLVTTRLKTEKERTATEKLMRELMERYKVRIHGELLK